MRIYKSFETIPLVKNLYNVFLNLKYSKFLNSSETEQQTVSEEKIQQLKLLIRKYPYWRNGRISLADCAKLIGDLDLENAENEALSLLNSNKTKFI